MTLLRGEPGVVWRSTLQGEAPSLLGPKVRVDAKLLTGELPAPNSWNEKLFQKHIKRTGVSHVRH